MRRSFLIAGLAVAVVLAVLWASGGFDALIAWASEAQREVQTQLAGAVRRLKAGEAGALAALLGVAFAYGFFHAVGPGHGKVLIGGYGAARRVRLLPLAALALVSSLAQATVAVVLVYAFVLALGWTRERVEGMSDAILLPASQVAIALIGLWLVWRGVRGIRALGQGAEQGGGHGHHDHDHVHDAHCGHAHAPTLEEVQALRGWKDAALLVFGIAIRPCSGALFLLIITWTLGLAAAGIAGVYAMGLGTAVVTIAVAGLSVWAREGALATLSGGAVARALPVLELTAGAVIAAIALVLLSSAL